MQMRHLCEAGETGENGNGRKAEATGGGKNAKGTQGPETQTNGNDASDFTTARPIQHDAGYWDHDNRRPEFR